MSERMHPSINTPRPVLREPAAREDSDEDDVVVSAPAPADVGELLRVHGDRYRPILAALRDQPWKELMSSRDLLDALDREGFELSERTLRLYLAEMTDAGLIERHGRRGYRLAAAGALIARELTIARRLGAIVHRMEETMCRLSFDLARGTGLVSINAYVIPCTSLPALCDELEAVFAAGLAVGSRVLVVPAGEDILGRVVPEGCIGLGTMCSLTLASLLMARACPSHPIFGGLLQIAGNQPQYFLEMIRYDATSLSPNEVFIRANLTSVGQAARTGSGAITASFREVPVSALPRLREVAAECQEAGFTGLLTIGRPGRPLLNIPVPDGRVGVILATGLNPLASLWEHDHRAGRGEHGSGHDGLESARPMVGPAPYESMIPYQQFRRRVTVMSGRA